jgi:hypothetical protein
MDSSSPEPLTPDTTSRRRRADASPRQRASRKPIVEKKVAPSKKVTKDVPEVDTSDQRKAPTPFASTKARTAQKRKQLFVVVVLMAMGLGASAGVGFTDDGQINVKQTIEDRNNRIRTNNTNENDVLISNIEIPVQNTNTSNKPDGGLIGRPFTPEAPKPVAPIATSTATSSSQMASSTDAIASSSAVIAEEDVEPAEDASIETDSSTE